MLDVALPLLEFGLTVDAGDCVLIVADQMTDRELVDACWGAALALDARPSLVQYHNGDLLPQSRLAYFPKASLEGQDRVPSVVSAAAEHADAVIVLASDLSMLVSQERFERVAAESKVVLMPYMSAGRARRLLPSTGPEYEEVARDVCVIEARLRQASTAHLTSPAGTDLHMDLGHYEPRVHLGRACRGAPALMPGGQTTVIPSPGSARGVLVVDRSIADDDYRELHEPIRCVVEGGRVVDLQGGTQARRLERLLAEQEDDRVYHLTELGVGSNYRCTRTAIGAPTEDTHTRGAVSLALGCDTHIGGVTSAPMHIDMTSWFPTLLLDDEPIVVGGVLQVGPTTTPPRQTDAPTKG